MVAAICGVAAGGAGGARGSKRPNNARPAALVPRRPVRAAGIAQALSEAVLIAQ